VAPKFWRRIQNLEVRASTILLSPKFPLARKWAFSYQNFCCNVTVWELVRRWMQRISLGNKLTTYCGKYYSIEKESSTTVGISSQFGKNELLCQI
jgi:hypothetical protein